MNAMKIAIYTLLVLGASVVWGSCQRGGDEDTAQVTLRLATRAATVTDQDGNLGDEGIKTLQIFLYKQEGGSYAFYRKDVVKVTKTESGTVTVELDDIQLGFYRFYAVANGESVGLEFNDEKLSENDLKGKVIIDIDNAYFPKKKSEIATNGLPMAGFTDVKVNNKSVSATIDLYRAVAKLDITLTNETGTPLTVNEINFGEFGADKAFLFKQESGDDVPADREYKEISFDKLSTEIGTEGNNTANFTFYVYPSAAGQTAYTMGLATEQKTYSPVPLMDKNDNELTSMPRNTLYKITAIVDQDVIRFQNFTVNPWGESHSGGDINIGEDVSEY